MKIGDVVRYEHVYHGIKIGIVVNKNIPQHIQKEYVIVCTTMGIERWWSDHCEVISEAG